MPGFKKFPNAKPIVNITIDEELLKKIEDFKFSNRFPNRSQAFTSLIIAGFEHLESQNKLVEYVSFEEAMKAASTGENISFCPKNNTRITFDKDVLLKHGWLGEYQWKSLLEGKWIIEK